MEGNGPQPQDEMHLIPTSLAVGIVGYLSTKPYNEVAQLIAQLTQLPKAPTYGDGFPDQVDPGPLGVDDLMHSEDKGD